MVSLFFFATFQVIPQDIKFIRYCVWKHLLVMNVQNVSLHALIKRLISRIYQWEYLKQLLGVFRLGILVKNLELIAIKLTKVSEKSAAWNSSPTEDPKSLEVPMLFFCLFKVDPGLPAYFFEGTGVNGEEVFEFCIDCCEARLGSELE